MSFNHKMKDFVENGSIIDREDDSSGPITVPYRPSDIRIDTHPMNLGDLIEMIDAKWINFDTEYQRLQNLWSEDVQSRFIESILLGLRLPAFYFEEVTRREWNIIDGLQRCCAIRNFCVDKTFKLSGLEFLGKDFDGKGYDDFPFEVRRDVRMLPVTVNILERGTPPSVKYILFKRLNTAGVTLKPQEIRTAMYQSVVPVLRRMTESPDFIRVTGGKISPKRQDDKDFVSRFIAFYLQGFDAYKPDADLDSFVNDGMEILSKKVEVKSSSVEAMEKEFSRALCIAEKIFGEDAFRKRLNKNDSRKPLNKAYFEVLTVTFSKLSDEEASFLIKQKELLQANLIRLMNRPVFLTSISTGTGMHDRVQTRFRGVVDAIDATMHKQVLE